jgi:hypothetical protein
VFKKLLVVLLGLNLIGCGGSSSGEKEIPTQPIIQSYEVSATTSTGGVITPTNQSIQSGNKATLNISPDEGYEIGSVVGCNGSLDGSIYTTGVITAACEISATFKLKVYTVSSLTPDGGVSISPQSQNITHGDGAVFNIEQNTGIGQYEINGCNGYLDGSTYTIDAVTSDCQISTEFSGDFLGLSLYPQHEDSSIAVSIDLAQTDVPNTELGFVIYKENNVEYYSSENAGQITSSNIQMPISKKVYRKIVPNLKADSEYEICMSGINNVKSTGFFGCKKIKTSQKKIENGLIVINHDVETEAIELINDWIVKVEGKNSHIKLKTHNLQSGATAEILKNYLNSEYNSSNLRHVVLIGYGIPALTTKVSNADTKLLGLYSSLSEVERGDWSNEDQTNAAEVTIAVIKPQDITISSYLRRLINFYDGGFVYPNNILLADAMIASEKTIVRSDIENNGLDIDMITGFEDEIEIAEAIRWQDEYSQKLLDNEYGLLFIAAHGGRLEHYPCGTMCIDYDFIKQAEPKVKFTIAISCNIGHVLTENSPMLSYVFGQNSGSLSALAGEVLYFDDGSSARRIMYALNEREMSIGEVSRIFGFIVVGDPFLTLN